MGVDRGNQILCQLDRIARVIGYHPRRIGLSATIGDIENACAWLGGNTNRKTVAPIFDSGKVHWKLALEHFFIQDGDNGKNNEMFDAGYEFIYEAAKQKKSIIFSNSREETEYVQVSAKRSHLGIKTVRYWHIMPCSIAENLVI